MSGPSPRGSGISVERKEGEGVDVEVVHALPHLHGEVKVTDPPVGAGRNEGANGACGGLPFVGHFPRMDGGIGVGVVCVGDAQGVPVRKGEPVEVGITKPLAAHDDAWDTREAVESQGPVGCKVTRDCVRGLLAGDKGLQLAVMGAPGLVGKAVERTGGIHPVMDASPEGAATESKCRWDAVR